jgi:hypothetical protein
MVCVALVKIEFPVAHYLERRSFGWHTVHILSHAQTVVLVGVLLQRTDELVLIFYVNNFFCLSVERVVFEPETLWILVCNVNL